MQKERKQMALQKHEELTRQNIGAFYAVYGELGYGFNEKVYENAMLIELRRLGLQAISQVEIVVYYFFNPEIHVQ